MPEAFTGDVGCQRDIKGGNVRCGVGDVEALLVIQQRRCVDVAVMSVDAMSV
jgi:hypothetical protein